MGSKWETKRADKFCSSVTDGTHDSPKASEKGYPLITSKHLQDYSLDFASTYLVSDEDYKKIIVRSRVEKEDILFSMIGTVGRIYREKNDLCEYAIKNVGLFKFDGDVHKSAWMYYYLKTPSALEYIESRKRGSTQGYVPLAALRELPVQVPPAQISRAIIATLSALDDKIELNNRIIANLEAQAQAIFKSWFVDFEPFQDGEFEESELGLIPKGWRCGTFSDLGNIEGGSTPSKSEPSYYCENGIPWITPRDLSSDKRKFIDRGANDITESGLKNSSAKILPAGTVLFSSRAPIGYITIAKNGVSTNQGFKSIIPFKMIGTAYVYYYLKQNTDRIIAAANGSTFKEISGTVLKNLPALVPEAQILKDFSAFCETLFKQQAVLEEQNGILTITRDALLPKLMLGEIEVPVEGIV